MHSLNLSEDERKAYAVVKGKFDSHFIKRRNIIFERAKFNLRRQKEGEPVYSLAEHCGFGALHDELVVGIRDAGLSEKLQLDPDLTLNYKLDCRPGSPVI